MSTNPQRQGKLVQGKFDAPKVRSNYRGSASVNWHDVDPDDITDIVRLCTQQGSAVMFGCVSDGGALSLCILDGDKKIKEYPRTREEIHSLALWLRDDYYGK